MLSDIRQFEDRMRPIGVLYVDVHPFRVTTAGSVEFLLFRRIDGIPLAGQWQTVSGKIAKGERIADAFVRQVHKKTGSTPVRLWKLAEVTTFFDEYYDTIMMVPGAAAELPGDAEIHLDASLHQEYRWVDLNGAYELLPWPGQRRALAAIAALAADGQSFDCTLLPASAFTPPQQKEEVHD